MPLSEQDIHHTLTAGHGGHIHIRTVEERKFVVVIPEGLGREELQLKGDSQ
jgi:hypothetical protein